MADKAITRRLKIYVNGEEVDATISNLTKSLSKFRAQSNRAVEGSEEWKKYNAEVAKLETELKQARDAQKQFRADTKLTEQGISKSEEALSKFTGSFSTMIQGYKNGDILQVKEGFNGVKDGIAGATKAALAFIATPIGATIAGLVLIGTAAKKWFDYNSAVVEALRLTQQITGLTDAAADAARIRGEALVKTFGVDFKEVMETAATVSKQFNISFNEAMDVVEEGLVRGQKNNDEYFKSLKEYPTFFNSLGFSAQEFRRIIEAGYDLKIYSDKFPDALKEFDLALKEQTQATRDALVNAFGAPFTNDILKRVRTGQTTSKEALEELAVKAKESNINIQQNAQLTADLFKGAGEDAGGALKIFEAYDIAIVQNQRSLTESEQITQDQINATKELSAITSALFATGDKGFGLWIDKAKLFGTKILVDILKAGLDVYNWVVDLNNESTTFSAILTAAQIAATTTFDIIGILIQNAKTAFGGLGDVIEGIFTLDIDKIREGMAQGITAVGGVISDIKAKAISDAEEIKKAFAGGTKLERKELGDFTSTSTDGAPEKNTITKDNFQDQVSQKLKAAIEKNEASVTDFLKKEQEKRELLAKDSHARELAEIDIKYAAMLEKAGTNKDLIAQLEDAKALEKQELEAQRERERLERIRLIQEENALVEESQRLEREALAAETQEERDRLLLERAQIIASKELEIEEKKALDLLRINNATEEEILAVKKRFSLQKVKIDSDFTTATKALKSDEVQWTKLTEEQKLSAITGALGSAAEAFNAGSTAWKAIKIAETTITTYQSAVNSYNALSGIPIVGPALGAVAAGLAVATGIAQVVKIKNTPLTKVPKPSAKSFARGGDTGTGDLGLGSNSGGFIRGVVEEDEYVVPKFVRQMPGVPRVIQFLEAKRTGQTDSFAEGGEVSGSPVPASTSDGSVLNEILAFLKLLMEKLDNGIYLNFTLNDEINRRELAAKLDATLKESKGK